MHARTSVMPVLVVSALAASCGPIAQPSARATWTAHAVRGGTRDPADAAVVGVVRTLANAVDICTGSLIAPNVVLTAHHCVADVQNAPNGTVSCAQSSFAQADTPDNLLVTTETDLPTSGAGYHGVVDVIVPASSTGTRFCGVDMAILVLAEPLAVAPLTPRLDEDLHDGDSYDAVGYGAIDTASSNGDGAGTRRRLDGLVAECVGESCGNDPGLATGQEWVGGGGPCQGDSGGPALDASGRVTGVVSRADEQCTSAVYEDVFAAASFLRTTTISAADRAGIAPPAWTGSSAARAPGCTSVAGSAPSLAALAVLLALTSAGCARRRRP